MVSPQSLCFLLAQLLFIDFCHFGDFSSISVVIIFDFMSLGQIYLLELQNKIPNILY